MKKLAFLLVVFTICFQCLAVYASPDAYTIKELQNIAVSNSKQAKVDDIDIRVKELAIKQIAYDGGVLNDTIQREVRPMELASELAAAKMKKQDNLQSLKIDIYNVGFEMLLTEKQRLLEEQKLKIIQERLAMARTRYKLDIISSADVALAEYNLESKKLDISRINSKLISLSANVKRLTDLQSDSNLVSIKDTLKVSEFIPINDIKAFVDNIFDTFTSVFEKCEAVKAKQKAMDIAKKVYIPGDNVYDSSSINLELALLDANDTNNAVKVDLENKYNELLNKKDTLELASKYVELSKKKLSYADIKFSKGVLSKENLLTVKEQYLDAEYSWYYAIYEFNVLNADFSGLIKK